MFHLECIGTWLSKKDHCPLCRAYVDSENYVDYRECTKKRLKQKKEDEREL